jgi:hypothetical protein
MKEFRLERSQSLESIYEVIQRGEPFRIRLDGFRGKRIKKIWEIMTFELLSNSPTTSFYSSWTTPFFVFGTSKFQAVYMAALEENMSSQLKEETDGISIEFRKSEEGQLLKEKAISLLEEGEEARKNIGRQIFQAMTEAFKPNK